MEACEQTAGLSVLEHGKMVNRYYTDIYEHLLEGKELVYDWRLPDWVYQYKEYISANLLDKAITDEYQLYHDCGKPYCLVVEDGKSHFPNHAATSYHTWISAGGNLLAAELMLADMDVHLMKDEQVVSFCKSENAVTLLLTALAEIHANCGMFGGEESVSFKIKYKHLKRRGGAILRTLTG